MHEPVSSVSVPHLMERQGEVAPLIDVMAKISSSMNVPNRYASVRYADVVLRDMVYEGEVRIDQPMAYIKKWTIERTGREWA